MRLRIVENASGLWFCTSHDACVHPVFIVFSSGIGLENQIRETLSGAFAKDGLSQTLSTITDLRAVSAIDGSVLLRVIVTRIRGLFTHLP